MSEQVSIPRMRDSVPPPENPRSSEGIVGESPGRPRGKIRQFLQKVKNSVTKRRFRLKDSRSHDPVLPNVDNQGADLQSVLRDANEAAKRVDPLSGPVESGALAAQNAQVDLETTDNIQDTYLQSLKIFDSVIEKIADVHPYAKMALGVLSRASKTVLAQVDHAQEVHRLVGKLDQVYDFMTQDETLDQISSRLIILGQISQQTLECAHFIRDYSEIKNFWKRLGKDVLFETDDVIRRYNDVLDGLMHNFRDQVACDVAIYVHRTGEIDLSGMAYATGAGLDTSKQCLSGTRTELLSQITDWINSSGDDASRVLWLSGPAGMGKSTIAHTVAKWFNDVGGLGSCYCFDRDREAEHLHKKIFSTIARDLAVRDPKMGRALVDAVNNATALKTTVDVVQQWQKLLVEPFEKLSRSIVDPIMIVIDALDESGGVETRSDLLRILASKRLPNNFRIIVTSSPLCDIEAEFTNTRHIQRMSMDDIPPAIAERDIHAYVSQRLEGLSQFGAKEFAALAKKADGLFEWARLTCEYIKAPPAGFSPNESFNAVVSRDPTKREHLLYDMYHFILTGIVRTDIYTNAECQQTQLARFRSVMGQILGAVEPLPLNSLNAMRNHFPDQSEHFEVQVMVEQMGSLLSATTDSSSPIRLLHVSFRDFLTNQSCSGEFFVDVLKVQCDLAFASLRLMEHGLRFNICDIKSSYLPNCEDTGLPERIQTCIPPHLSYACRFWAAHVRKTDFGTKLANKIKLFFDHERMLFWLEVLSLIDALNDAVPALFLIIQWLKGHAEYKDVSSTAMHMQRFIQIFGGVILLSTPHLYVSALPFSSLNSAIYSKFVTRFPNTLRLASGHGTNGPTVQVVLSRHTGCVNSASFSPDGTRIATGSADKTVWLWDAVTGQSVCEPLRGHTRSVNSVSFSPDGTRIVTGSDDQTVRLWDTATGQPVGGPLRGHTGAVISVSFSPDGNRIVTGSDDSTVRLWDAATGQPVCEPLRGHTGSVHSVSFSPDGTRIVTGSNDDTVRLWDAATGQPVGAPLEEDVGRVNSLSFSPDGTRIVTGCSDNTVWLLNAATGQPVGEPLLGHTRSVNSVSFSPDGTHIVTGSDDSTVRLWDTATSQPVGQPLLGHTAWVNSVSFSPDGTRIVSGSSDQTVRLWDIAQLVGQPLRGHTLSVSSVSFSPDGTRIVTGSSDKTIRLWDAVTAQPVGQPLRGHTDSVNSVSFSLDGTRIASGSSDQTVRLWDAVTREPVGQPLRGHSYSVNSVSFSPDGTRIASGSDDKTVRLWDTVTGQPVGQPLRGHTGSVNSVLFSPNGTCIASGSSDQTARLWDAATGQPVGEPLRGHTDSVHSVSFSPDGIRIVTGSWDCSVRLWDASTGQPASHSVKWHTDSVHSASFSPDGTRIVSGSDDKTVRLWDAVTGQPVGQPLRGHIDSVRSVSFSPDGTRIVSCSEDETVRVWYAVAGQPLQACAKTDPSTTSNNDFVRFSSNSTHVLLNAAQLLEGTPHDDSTSTSFLLEDDGWMLGPNRRLLFWVPPASREAFSYNPWTVLVIPRGYVELDLSHMAHGTRWQYCRDDS